MKLKNEKNESRLTALGDTNGNFLKYIVTTSLNWKKKTDHKFGKERVLLLQVLPGKTPQF